MKRLFILLMLCLCLGLVFAHQPRLPDEHTVHVERPEVSQAFYAELKGEPDHYEIDADQEFDLYVGLSVPDLQGIDKDVSAEISKDGEILAVLDGENVEWTPFFESFAGDDYFSGPDFKQRAPAGHYEIEVYSPDNQGKYVLAVGETEAFTFTDTVETLLLLPSLKQDFFEKPVYTAYFNIMGLFLLVPIILLALIIAVIYWYWKRVK
jgi:hypothetical protein